MKKLYEDATVRMLSTGQVYGGCRCTIDNAGTTEIVIPHLKTIITSHVQNLMIITDLDVQGPNNGHEPDLNAVTVRDYQYCETCGLLVHNRHWNKHVLECYPRF